MASGKATVKQVVDGSTLVLVGAPKGGPPPEKTVSLASIFAPRMAMKSLTKETQDESLAFEARELMRQKLIGKVVDFKVEYVHNGREHATVKFEGKNVAEYLLRAGLAKLKQNKNPPCAPDYDDLMPLQEAAEAAKVGLFDEGSAAKAVREIKWGSEDKEMVKKFVADNKGKRLKAIVEYVRDGACMRLYFPESKVFAAVILSGLQVDGFKRVEGQEALQPEPLAAETKYFVESRLLNRDVECRIEGHDEYGNIYGTVHHPNGNISLLLLKNGYAKIVEQSGRLTESPAQLREAVKEAQKAKLRKWRDWTPSEISGPKEYHARVLEVVSGDCVIVQTLDSKAEKRLYLASIRGPKGGSKGRDDEPWAWDAKEFCRKKLAGKKVKVVVEYMKPPFQPATGALPPPPSDASGKMHFVSIFYDNDKVCLNETLVEQGFAKCQPHRADDDRAANFDKLLELEKAAMDKKAGIHGPESAAPKHRFNDLIGPSNAQRAKSFEASLQRLPKLEGIVEHVFNAARFKVRIPSENLVLSFCLAGIRAPAAAKKEGSLGKGPKESEPFAEEALTFAKEQVMQQEVTLKVEVCDRGGNFIGSMWRGKGTAHNFAAELLELGYAQTVDFSVQQSAHRDLLLAAEGKAKAAKLKVWSVPGALEAAEPVENAKEEDVDQSLTGQVVCHVNSCTDFYIQDAHNSTLDEVQSALAALESESAAKPLSLPRKGEVVAAKFSADGQWYRAKVEARDTAADEVSVTYVDYGNGEVLPASRLRALPAGLALQLVPAQAKQCRLSGLLTSGDYEEEAGRYLNNATADQRFNVKVERIGADKKRAVVLTEEEAAAKSGPSVNELLVRQGLARLDKKSNTKIFSRLQKEEEAAKKAHLNVWRYGDVGDEEDEFDFPPMNPKAQGGAWGKAAPKAAAAGGKK